MEIRILQLFSKYGEFYQPYIPLVMDVLKEQRGIDIEVVAFKGDNREKKKVAILPNYWVRKILEIFFHLLNKKNRHFNYLEIKALREKVDIIHIQHSYLYSHVLKLLELPKADRPKVVITLRGGDTYIKPWLSEKWQHFYKNYGDKVDAFIVMSEDQKNYLTKWKVPSDSIHIIPISLGHSFQVNPKGPNKNKIRLVSVFRMCWEKNIAGNLQLVKALIDKDIPVTYDIYGDGPDLGQVYYLRDRLNLNDIVNIHGKVSNAILKQELRAYDFILQLSWSESLGMSVIEAQSLGVPGIVSKYGGFSEVIQDKKNGFIFDLYEREKLLSEIISVWSNQTLYTEMSTSAISLSHQNYTVEHEVSKLVRLYNELITMTDSKSLSS